MSSSLTQLYLSNPAMATAIRRQQEGMQIANEGMSAAPASPWQALARLGQAALGTYMDTKASGAIKDYADQQNQADQDFSSRVAGMLGGGSQTQTTQPQVAPQDAVPSNATDTSIPRTTRLNNPGALKFAGQPGAVNVDGFALFPNADAGAAAADANLAGYAGKGINTLRGAISRWAPPSENNTDAYVAKVAQATGINPDAPIDLTDPAVRAPILKQIYAYEGGPRAASVAQPGAKLVNALTPQPGGDPMAQARRWQALALEASGSTNPRIKARAPELMQMAAQAIQSGRSNVVTGPNGEQYNEDYTGKRTPVFTSPPRIETDARNVTRAYYPDNRVVVIADNSGSFKDDNSRIMADIGPKILDGTATDTERQKYELAAGNRAGYKVTLAPDTNKLMRTADNPVPPTLPPTGATPTVAAPNAATAAPPGSAPPSPQAAAPAAAGPNEAQPLTAGGFGQKAASDAYKTQSEADAKAISEAQTKANEGQHILGTTATIRALVPKVKTGVWAEARLDAARVLSSFGVPPDKALELIGTEPVSGELLQKRLFELSTKAVREMGAREPGSVIGLFMKNYPSMESQPLTIDTMSRLLDMDHLHKMADASARSAYYRDQNKTLKETEVYPGMGGYKPPDPVVYQAAALASGGMPYETWTRGLSEPQQVEALKLAASAYPDARAMNANKVLIPLQRAAPR